MTVLAIRMSPAVSSAAGTFRRRRRNADGLIARFKHETEAALESVGGEDDASCGFAFLPVTVAEVSPSPVNGWYRNPEW